MGHSGDVAEAKSLLLQVLRELPQRPHQRAGTVRRAHRAQLAHAVSAEQDFERAGNCIL